MSWYRWSGDDLLLDIATQPGAKRNEILGLHGGRLKVRIQAPPVDGRANAVLLEFFADCFSVPKSRVGIDRGQNSRQKLLRIQAATAIPSELTELGLKRP